MTAPILPVDDEVDDPSLSRRMTTPDNSKKQSNKSIDTPVPPSSFYGNGPGPPPLPTRPKKPGPGSAYTTYMEVPPDYPSPTDTTDYEPQIRMEGDDGVELGPEDDVFERPSVYPAQDYHTSRGWGDVSSSSRDPWSSTSKPGAGGWDAMDDSGWSGGMFDSDPYRDDGGATRQVDIDGRIPHEELNWWEADRHQNYNRPGAGMLPSGLEERLHDSEHSLFFIEVTPPDIRPAPSTSTAASTSQPSTSVSTPSSSQTAFSSPSSPPPQTPTIAPPQPPPHIVPTDAEVRESRPHPNAYYCRRDNSWIILQWKTSTVTPPLTQTFMRTFIDGATLPDKDRRARTTSCVGDEDANIGIGNVTHHFHQYERAADASRLNPPFEPRYSWEKGKVRDNFDGVPPPRTDQEQAERDHHLLDLYMCCQCSLFCIVSRIPIPGVVPVHLIDQLVDEKHEKPALGKTKEATVATAFEMILMAIENKLWKGENRALPVTGKTFSTKVGWNEVSRRLFQELGFEVINGVTSPDGTTKDILQPPNIDPSTPRGKAARARLLRGWVELGAWYSDYRRRFPSLKEHNAAIKTWVNTVPSRIDIQRGIGALHDQLPRGILSNEILHHSRNDGENMWTLFGMTPETYTWTVLAFAYMAQCRCDPKHTPQYFSQIVKIFEYLVHWGVDTPPELQTFLIEERARGRFSVDDFKQASAMLGFGADNKLRIELADADNEFIVNAWKDAIRRSWLNMESDSKRNDLNEAFKIVAQYRKSVELMNTWTKDRGTGMSLDRAYQTLDLPRDVDETFLLTVYELRVIDQPLARDRMKEALTVIAESRDSDRLRKYLETGLDPGNVPEVTRTDWPRGLNQLGNTCYLNSLLQYFYTIRDLRDAIQPLAALDAKALSFDKLTDDELKRHRVGGRNVTRREITRSKRFVSLLADLFSQLAWAEIPAVTPEIELAKLALVTSKDEEEEEGDKGTTDSSHSTDATLVDDAPMHTSVVAAPAPTTTTPPATTVTQYPSSPAASRRQSPALTDSPGSVLGKRPRETTQVTQSVSNMDVDTSESQNSDSTSASASGSGSPSSSAEAGSSSAMTVKPFATEKGKESQADEDVEMLDAKPALPSRKKTVVSDSVMMFGRQHDVSECMDNCVFQIETALLDFNDLAGAEDAKASVVKRLFFGKIRQRISSISGAASSSSVHEKEDIFSNLPINISSEGFDIYDGLSEYFDDVVEFEGQKARMQMTLVDLPPLLQIQLQRVQFNRETMQPYKSQAYLKFGETIYMDRFLDGADPEKRARAKEIQGELTICRERIQALTQGKHAPFHDALENAAAFLQDKATLFPEIGGSGSDLHTLLKTENVDLKAELELLRARTTRLKLDLEAVWSGGIEAEYELTSVFIHRGSSPSWGHYFFYSRNLPENPDEWFKYNDSDVSTVSKDEVLADTTGSTANPYLLVYVRKGSEVVQTIHRPLGD